MNEEIIFTGCAGISWNCKCGHTNIVEDIQLDSVSDDDIQCEACQKEYTFNVSVELEEAE